MSWALMVPEPAVTNGLATIEVEVLVSQLDLGPHRRVVVERTL